MSSSGIALCCSSWVYALVVLLGSALWVAILLQVLQVVVTLFPELSGIVVFVLVLFLYILSLCGSARLAPWSLYALQVFGSSLAVFTALFGGGLPCPLSRCRTTPC